MVSLVTVLCISVDTLTALSRVMPETSIKISKSFSTAESLLSGNISRQDETFFGENSAQKQHKFRARRALRRTVSETSLEKYRQIRAARETRGLKDSLFPDIREKTGKMSETKKEQKNTGITGIKDTTKEDSKESGGVKNEQERYDSEGSGSSKDDKDNEMTIKMNKPWPPLAAEFTGKPRSYSDTSPRREIIKATKGDIRSCTSYMHLPHISALKPLSHPASSPHLHQSFSRMHLPHSIDPDDDFPTVSVIALADARDRDGDDEVIYDDDVRDIYSHVNDVEEDSDTVVKEEAIYTWDREFGRTRSLSEPTDFNSLTDMTRNLDQRPRAMSLESADKAKKPPSRIQFQSTLEELAEEHSNEREIESANDDTDLDNLTNSSILVLAESRDFETDSSHTDTQVKESDSQDEVLTRWTRYESHPIKNPSFYTELSTIDEKLGEGLERSLPTGNRSRSASVLALVDEVTEEVMSNESLVNESLGVQTGSHFGGDADIDPRLIMRRTTLGTTSPTSEAHGNATEIERRAFNKISQWKTDFAVKLEDVLSKGKEHRTDEKQQKSVVINVPMDLTNDELKMLKGDMLTELRRKSNAGELWKSPLSQRMLSAVYNSSPPKDTKDQVGQEIKGLSYSDDKDIKTLQLLNDTRDSTLSKETHRERPSSPENLDRITISKDKITELLQWHDQERKRLLLELKKMQVSSESPGTPSCSAQVVLDSAGLERVFYSLQVIMDSIFKETILRLRGTLESDILEDKRSGQEDVKVERTKQQRKEDDVSKTTGIEKIDTEQTKPGKKDKERTQDTTTTQPSTETDVLEKQSKIAKQKTRENRIPVPVRKTTKRITKPKQVKISSTQEKFRPTSAAHKKSSTKPSSPIHVHTTSFAEHVCHRDTCTGMADDSSPTCECDSASDEIDTTTDLDRDDYTDETTGLSATDSREYYQFSDYQIKKLKGRPEVFPGGSSTNETADFTPSSSTSIPQLQSTSTLTSDKDKDKEKSDGFSSEENEKDLDFEESDACSEIADLLGVYQVYNAVNDNEIPRPHAPELMTYEEKDMRDKLNRQKVQLKGYKRMVRSFKNKNKRLKEERSHLRRQIQEWHDRCTKKEARISELKHEIEPVSFTVEDYRRVLEDKSNIIKMKEKQILKLLGSDVQGSDGRSGDHEQDTFGSTSKESGLEYELANKKCLKTILRDKEKVIQELVVQHEKTFQELTKKIYKVMSERDELKKENSRLKTLSGTEELERKKKNIEVQVSRLEKELKETKLRYEEKERVNKDLMSSLQKKLQEYSERHDEDSRLLFETQKSYEELKTSSSSKMEEQEEEISSLKASVNAFQSFVQGMIEEQNDAGQKQLHGNTRSAQADHSFMKAALNEAVCAKEDETKRHQQTQVKLQEANQRLKNINSMFDKTIFVKENMIAKMTKQLQSLQDENGKLKRHLKEKKESTSILIEVTELQAKLAKRDCEIKELRQENMKQKEETRKILKQLAKQSSLSRTLTPDTGSPRDLHGSLDKTSELSHDLADGKCLSLAQRCARQWKEETDLQQQELDELRGKTTARPSTDSDDTTRLRKDMTEMKNALDDFLKTQSEYRIIAQDELKEKLELKAKEMEKQESFYREIIETKEKAYADVVKEKNTMIQILNESKNLSQKGQSEIDKEAFGISIKDAIERSANEKIDELRKSIEMISKLPPKSEVLNEVITDLLKMNERAVERLEGCTELAWTNVKEDLDELRDFTFKMTDAIEKHFYSTQEYFSEMLNNSIEEVTKYVKNESNAVRKSFLEGMQAHYEVMVDAIKSQESAGIARYENLLTSIDGYNRCNVREVHQARRDVLLAAEAVSNTAEELHQIKKTLLHDFSSKEIIDMDEFLRQGQKENEIKEKRKTATKPYEAAKPLQKVEHEYSDKAKIFETNPTLKEQQQKESSVTKDAAVYSRDGTSLDTTAELANQEGTRLRDSLSSTKRVPSTGEMSRTIQEEELRHSYQSLYHTPPSRDSDGFSLRERLQQKARGTNSDGVSHPYTRTALFWSRDKPPS